MKKKWWLFACLLIFSAAAKAQTLQITRMEYYFDVDPGVGNGGMMTLVSSDSVDMTSTIAVWSNLSPGYHWLYVRSFYDSAGVPRAWSHTAAQQIYIPDSLVYAEYFFDTDPGQGNGTQLPLANTSDSFNQTFSIPTSPLLTVGRHNLYVRSRSVTGRWSMAEPVDFYTPGAINGGEYFFGVDPGVGNGTPFSFAVTDSLSTTLNVPLPVLSAGVHQVFVRTRTATGVWGQAYGVDFFMNGAVVSGEYFFDTDPGTGNGTPFTFAPGDSAEQNLTVNTTALNGGEHRLYVRSRDNSGRWSHADEAFFYLLPKIVRGEYYWDADPGVGNGISLFTGGTSDSMNQNFTLNAPCLPPGKHKLSVRTRDDQGKWSLIEYDSLSFANPAMALATSLPGPGPFGTPVKLTATGGRLPYQYQMNSNAAGADSILLAPNETTVLFTATDSCGYTATASVTTPDDPTDISLLPTASGSVSLSGWGHWVYLLDGNGEIIGAVNDGRQDLGNTTLSYKHIEAPDTVRSFAPDNPAHYLDRNWHIASARAPQQPVGLRLYAADAEWNRYTAAEPTVSQYSQLHLTKYNGPNQDLDYSNNVLAAANYTYFSPDSTGVFSGKNTSGFHANYHVPGFSELYLNRDLNVPLSLSKIEVRGKADGDRIRIDWETAGEEDLLRYELMKQGANGGWQMLEPVAAQNKPTGFYTAFDSHPVSGKNIYQIRIVEANGKVSYSPAVMVYYNQEQAMAIFPNPAADFVNVNGVEAGSMLILTDISEKTIASQPVQGPDNRFSVAGLAGGVYQLIIRRPNGEQVQVKIYKQ